MKFIKQILLTLLISISSLLDVSATDIKCDESNKYYTFSWPISDGCNNSPRGGTSKGAKVEISQEVHEGWLKIQGPQLTKFERDRAAILAMAGGYKVDFNFLETVGYSSDFERDRPYHSWGTEYVYVIEDQPEFISLQHLMVMYFEKEDGTISAPFVMKHWRQDWTYQDENLLEYQSNNQWKTRSIDENEAKGKWSQAVFQVDDSPRYESIGHWSHNASFSSWLSATTRRPLPRREYSVRKDYDLLEGFNRHTITRHGWVQEEENWKLSLNENGLPNTENPYLSKEEGVARYQLSSNVDFTAGDEYMKNTASFWKAVRSEWAEIINSNPELSLKKTVDGKPLFMTLFSIAETEYSDDLQMEVERIISDYLD